MCTHTGGSKDLFQLITSYYINQMCYNRAVHSSPYNLSWNHRRGVKV